MAKYTDNPAPWSVWEADAIFVQPVVVCLGRDAATGRTRFVGLKSDSVSGLFYLDDEDQHVSWACGGTLKLRAHLGELPSGIQRYAWETICQQCGKTAVYMVEARKWVCGGNCADPLPITKENPDMVEWLMDCLMKGDITEWSGKVDGEGEGTVATSPAAVKDPTTKLLPYGTDSVG